MYYTDIQVFNWLLLRDSKSNLDLQSGQKRELFDPNRAPIMPKSCLLEDQQEKNESRRCV